MAEDDTRLDSWKEIARYLNRDVRTAVRWERSQGLPVHRVPGGRQARVFAYRGELDRWLASTETPKSDWTGRMGRWRALLPGVAAAVVIAGVGIWALMPTEGPLNQLTLVGNELRALDARGGTRWTHRFQAGRVTPPPVRWTHISDVTSDGAGAILAAVEVAHPSLNTLAGELLSFSSDGHLRWSATSTDRLTFRDGGYGPPWAVSDLTGYRTAAGARIAWTLHHFTWWPALLITLDEEGRRLGTFVNSGWMHRVIPSLDGRHLFVTGVSNSRQAYFLAILDAANPSGHSPEPPGSATECVDCLEGDPLAYVVFPRTDVSRAQPFPVDGPNVLAFDDGRIEVHVMESGAPHVAATVYEVTPDLALGDARFSDDFWERHRRLEAEGQIGHRAEDCPERRGLEVKRWTTADGWQTIKVAAR